MYRGILNALLAGAILVAFAVLPPMVPGSTTPSLSGSAQAQSSLNSSRSNSDRTNQIASLLAQFPGGGPGLRAAIAAAVEADPALADFVVLAAKNANPAQKLAIGAGLADAANYFAKSGLDGAQAAAAEIRTAMASADDGTRAGFQFADAPTLVQGIPGFNNAGASTSRTISPSKP